MIAPEQQPHILIVDDEISNVAILERLFRSEYHTTSASTGKAALDFLATGTFDLVLLDIMMPNTSGLDVLRSIRETPETAELPVVLVSARMDEKDIVEGLSIGANDYITKPFRLSELRARVRTQITLKHLQDERKQTINELRAAHDLKDRFFRIASHDLKGPLGNLRLVHYLLRQRVEADAMSAELLSTADANLKNMQSVINEFLDMAALQSGVIDLHLDTVNVEPLLEDLLRQYHLNAIKKDITVDSARVTGTIYCDPGRFSQALGNLVNNALKYSPWGSEIAIWTEIEGARTRICVGDHGPGIPNEERDKLFTEFGKLSNRPTGNETSTGLGLWIAKHLTTLQGGEIGVDSPLDGGSVFWIEMPNAPIPVPIP